MPKQVKMSKGKTFEFKSAGTSQSKYPWGQILDGQLWELVEGEDFVAPITADDMKIKCKTAGRKQYKTVKCSTCDANGEKLTNSLIVQAFDMTDEQRETEDLRRAEEKDKTVAKRTAKKAGKSTEPEGDDD